jgi:hypothetical protein
VAGLAVAATPIAASAATGHAGQAHRSCVIRLTQSADRNNAGYYKFTNLSESGCSPLHGINARVVCQANNGTTKTTRDSTQATSGSRTAGCFNGSHPIHGGWNDNFTATFHSFF